MPVAVGFFLVLAVAMFFLVNSSYGRTFKACRDDYVAASLLGFNTAHYRNLSLAISGFYCGVSGALIAGYMSFIQPIMFDMAKSTELRLDSRLRRSRLDERMPARHDDTDARH